MIYIDTSVALANILPENRKPPKNIWDGRLVSSQLFEYELWNRVHAYKVEHSGVQQARRLLARMVIVEMTELVLARAFEPFPVAVRTLDGLHLATMDFLIRQGLAIELASYDNRMLAAARAMGVPIASL